MIIWRNEVTSPALEHTGILTDPPPGPVEITRAEERNGSAHIWFAPIPAVPAGMPPDPVTMMGAMAGMHHEWSEAWQAAGFTEEQAYGLVLGIVNAAFRQG